MKPLTALRAFIFATFLSIVGLAPGPQPFLTDRVLIRAQDGAELSALVVRPADTRRRLPAALEFTIYVEPSGDLARLEYAASRGYAGVIAYTRGKDKSPEQIVPYENDGRDANSVIDWIAAQPWSDGNVAMMGGSYDGFTQWAAAKYANPHLKTIVPEVANNPGNGLPMQNNVFLLANYPWIYYVANNKALDPEAYADPRFRKLPQEWYQTGRAYRDVDAVAGVPNPWLHKWLQHPAYDAYWQRMSPYRADYARIRVPVLTIDGYYGDSTAMGYFNDLARYNPSAWSYLVAGPWDHFGTQSRQKPNVLRGCTIDPAAHVDAWKLTFDWFDFVIRKTPRPTVVADRVNYEVMGENVWRHVPSLENMGKSVRLYLSTRRLTRRFYLLSATEASPISALLQTIDLANRTTANNDSYPYRILGKRPDISNGCAFLTPPFSRATEVSGLDGVFHLRVNKRDLDVGLALYEMMPEGHLMELTYYTQRASFADDMSKRSLLKPGKEAVIPFQQDYLFSRLVSKGSRLMLTVNVNKNPFAEINYGTGGDVASESIKSAGVPMKVAWLTSSYIRLHFRPAGGKRPANAIAKTSWSPFVAPNAFFARMQERRRLSRV